MIFFGYFFVFERNDLPLQNLLSNWLYSTHREVIGQFGILRPLATRTTMHSGQDVPNGRIHIKLEIEKVVFQIILGPI